MRVPDLSDSDEIERCCSQSYTRTKLISADVAWGRLWYKFVNTMDGIMLEIDFEFRLMQLITPLEEILPDNSSIEPQTQH